MPVTEEKATKKATCRRAASVALKGIVDIGALRGSTDSLFHLCWN